MNRPVQRFGRKVNNLTNPLPNDFPKCRYFLRYASIKVLYLRMPGRKDARTPEKI